MRTKLIACLLVAALLTGGLLSACQKPVSETSASPGAATSSPTRIPVSPVPAVHTSTDRYRSFYEIFVYSFADSDGDGIGDFKGLSKRLDYINDGDPTTVTDLGFDGIWLMPINPSPTYHKYDVTDYMAIDPQYGTMEDFKSFLSECDKRGIKVIIDLVLNHSSAQHPWFQEAIKALSKGEMDNPYIDYYQFSQEKKSDKYYAVPNAEAWFYEAVFWDQMPDLALDNEALKEEFKKIMQFWLDLGVFGFRLDAVTSYFTGDDSRNIEFLTWLNQAGKTIDEDCYFVAEAWTNRTGYTNYYASGIDSLFDFEAADSLGQIVSSVNTGNAQAYMQQLEKTQAAIFKLNDKGINAPFLSNHDMGRSAGFLSVDAAKMKLSAALYLFTSGSSFTYYGEEIGMRGSGRDENKRAPMLWASAETAHVGDQTGGPPAMEPARVSYPLGSVEEQSADPSSLLNYYIAALRLKNSYPVVARGITKAVQISEDKAIGALTKDYEGKTQLLLVFNFSAENKEFSFDQTYPAATLAGELCADDEVRSEGDGWVLPGYSVALFTLN